MEKYKYSAFLLIEGLECRRGKMLFDVYVFDQDINDFVHIVHDGEYAPGSTRGVRSEAMTALSNSGFIPKEYSDVNMYYTSDLPFKISDFEAPRFYR